MPNITEDKFSLLEKAFQKVTDLPNEALAAYKKAQKPFQLWQIIFANRLDNLYHQLLAEGISATEAELNQLNEDNISCWFLLAKYSPQIFINFLKKSFKPSSVALNAISNCEKISTWHLLADSDEGIHIFEKLLNLGYLPTPKLLSKIDPEDRTNTWHRLILKKNMGATLFLKLLDCGIYPTKNDFNIPDEWDLLSLIKVLIKEQKTNVDDLNKISNELRILNSIQNNKIQETNLVSILYMRPDKKNYWGFLYLFYLSLQVESEKISANDRNKCLGIFLHFDIWRQIGSYFLPSFINYLTLISNDNRQSFIKYNALEELTRYENSGTMFNRKKHKNRARSLKEALKADIEVPDELLKKQYQMAINTGVTLYKTPSSDNPKYRSSFKSKVDIQFKNLLTDACRLSPTLKGAKTKPVTNDSDENTPPRLIRKRK